MNSYVKCLSALALTALWAGSQAVTFVGSSGNLAAKVDFTLSGGDLLVTLTNTSTSDVIDPTQVLTAVFFNVAGDPAFTRVSGVLAPGSTVLFGGTDPGGVVGGEWAYLNGLSQYGANSGISSSGLGIFGPGNVFPGSNLQGPADPDGLQYGITSPVDNPLTGNAPVTGDNALIQNSVVFTLGGLPPGFDLNSIGSVTFQYGTALTDTSFPGGQPPQGGPVPGPLAALPFLAGLVVGIRRRLRA